MVARADILAGKAVILVNIQDTVDAQLRGIRNKLRAFNSQVGEIGGDLFRGGLALSAASFFPVKDFVTFQDQMLFVQTKLQVTDRAMKNLEGTIRDLGKSTSFTSIQVAQSAQMLAQAGFSLAEVQDSLQATLDLARGGQIDLTTSSAILTNAIRTFGKEASSASDFASKFITAARLGTLDLIDLGESLKYSSGTFAQFGVEIEEVLGLLSTLANSGLKASLAGTSLNTAFLNLASSAPKLREILGVQLDDTDFKNPLQALRKIEEALQSFSKVEQAGILQDIVNIRGGRAIQGLLLQGLDRVDANIQSIRNSTDEAAISAAKLDSRLGGVARRGLSAFQELLLSIGSTSEGPLTDFGNNLAGIFNDLSKYATKYQKFTQTLLLAGPAALVAGVGLLSMSFAAAKLAALLTPIMALSSSIISAGIGLVNLNLRLAGTVASLTQLGALRIIGKEDLKYAGRLASFQKKEAKLREAVDLAALTRREALAASEADGLERIFKLQERQTAAKNKTFDSLEEAARKQQQNELQVTREFAKRKSIVLSSTEQANTKRFLELQRSQASLREGLYRDVEARLESLRQDQLDLQTKKVTKLSSLQQAGQKKLIELQQEQATVFEKATKKLNDLTLTAQAKRDKALVSIANREIVATRIVRDEYATTYAVQSEKAAEAARKVQLAEKQVTNTRKIQQKELTAFLEAQATERQALADKLNELPPRKLRSSAGYPLSAQEAASLEKTEKLRAKLIQKGEKLTARQAESLVAFRKTQQTELSKIVAAQRLASQEQVNALEKLNKARAAAQEKLTQQQKQFATERQKLTVVESEELSDLLTSQGKKRAKLEAKLAEEQATVTKQYRKRIAKLNRSISEAEANDLTDVAIKQNKKLAKLQATIAEEQAQLAKTYRKREAKLSSRFQQERSSLEDKTKKAQATLLSKQSKEREALRESLSKKEAKAAIQFDKRQARLTAKLGKLDAPVDSSSFLTKQRSGGLFGLGGIVGAFKDIGVAIRRVFTIDFKKAFKGFDIIKTIHSGFRGIFSVAGGIFRILGKIRTTLFSLSGFLGVIEFLFLFGDKIPIISDMLSGLGKAFSDLFKDVTSAFQRLGPAIELVGTGLRRVFSGDASRGLLEIKQAVIEITDSLKFDLSNAFANFATNLKPATDRIKAIFNGLMGTFDAIIASLGGVLGVAFESGTITLKGDDDLLKTFQDAFSVDNINKFFAGVIGFIGSIGASMIKAVGYIFTALDAIKRVFYEMLTALGAIRFVGPDTSAALNALKSPERLALEDTIFSLEQTIAEYDRDIRTKGLDPTLMAEREEFRASLRSAKKELFAMGPAVGTAAFNVETELGNLTDALDTATANLEAATSPPEIKPESERPQVGSAQTASLIRDAITNPMDFLKSRFIETVPEGSRPNDAELTFPRNTTFGDNIKNLIRSDLVDSFPRIADAIGLVDADFEGSALARLRKATTTSDKRESRRLIDQFISQTNQASPDYFASDTSALRVESATLLSPNQISNVLTEFGTIPGLLTDAWNSVISKGDFAKEQEATAKELGKVSKVVGGTFSETRGQVASLSSRDKLQKKANEELASIKDNTSNLNNPTPFVFA